MMSVKAGNNGVPREQLLAIAREAGCVVEEQASYIKISRAGVKDQLLYVALTNDVGRVDLSGFELNEPEVTRYLGGEKFGRVHYQLRFDKPVAHIKAHFKQLCEGLGRFKSLPKSKRGRPVGLKGSKKLGAAVVTVKSELTPQQTIDFLVSELEKKRELAKKMGSNLSKKTELEYTKKIEELRKQINP